MFLTVYFYMSSSTTLFLWCFYQHEFSSVYFLMVKTFPVGLAINKSNCLTPLPVYSFCASASWHLVPTDYIIHPSSLSAWPLLSSSTHPAIRWWSRDSPAVYTQVFCHTQRSDGVRITRMYRDTKKKHNMHLGVKLLSFYSFFYKFYICMEIDKNKACTATYKQTRTSHSHRQTKHPSCPLKPWSSIFQMISSD